MKKFFKIALLVLLAAVFVGTFIFLYQKSKPEMTSYELYTPARMDLKLTSIVTGTVEPRDEVLIKPQISGIIAELYKEAGETVKTGEVIAKVKVIPEMSSLNSAENRVRLANISFTQAEIDYNRMKKLYDDKLVSSEDFEKNRVVYRQAKIEQQTAVDALEIVKEGVSRSNSSYSTTLIRSTINGLILDVPVKVGNSVIMSNTFNDGTTIASVANMNDLIFKGAIDETEVGRIREGMPVKITIGALQSKQFDAMLEYISPKVQSGNNQFEIKAAVRIPVDVKIRAGYSANAEIVLEQANKVIAIPEGAVEFSGDSTFVQVLKSSKPEQVFERKQIKVGLSDGIHIEVKSGLTLKDKIRGNMIIKSDK